MNDNLLLMYLSELGQGRWNQFRQALDQLTDEDDVYRSVKARQLSALGHVEFAFEGDMQWSICDASLAWLTRADRLQGVLCGQRSPQLLDQLQTWCKQLDCDMITHAQPEGPDVIIVSAPSSNVGEQLAEAVGLHSQLDAAERLAELLPNVTVYLELCSKEPAPRGYKTEKFHAEQLRWLEVTDDTSPGFYRYTHYRRDYRLKFNGAVLNTPVYIGIFAWLHHVQQTVFSYDAADQSLSGPVSAILPPLFARAAVLCSGFLPRFDEYHHIYSDVPARISHHLLQKLHQEKAL